MNEGAITANAVSTPSRMASPLGVLPAVLGDDTHKLLPCVFGERLPFDFHRALCAIGKREALHHAVEMRRLELFLRGPDESRIDVMRASTNAGDDEAEGLLHV